MINLSNIELPKFLESEFKVVCIKEIKLSKLRINVAGKSSKKIPNYLPIIKTPHYGFVNYYLYRRKEKPCLEFKNYHNYNKYNKHHLDTEKFKLFIDKIISEGFIQNNSKIICIRSKYFLFNRSYDVLDGSHRLAILEALNYKYIDVALAIRKENLIFRIFSKINKYIKNG